MLYLLICLSILIAGSLLYGLLRYSIFLPSRKGIGILMYHKTPVTPSKTDNLAVSRETFEKQMKYLLDNGYTVISFRELLKSNGIDSGFAPKTVLITFDDGYRDNYLYALPILEKYGLPATVALVVNSIGKTNFWDDGNESIISCEEIRDMQKRGIDFCLHSFDHGNYATMSAEEIENDLTLCTDTMNNHGISYLPVFAYPYGAQPSTFPIREKVRAIFKRFGIENALLIKSRINPPQLRNPYELFRIKISQSDSFFEFTTKLKRGRSRLFG